MRSIGFTLISLLSLFHGIASFTNMAYPSILMSSSAKLLSKRLPVGGGGRYSRLFQTCTKPRISRKDGFAAAHLTARRMSSTVDDADISTAATTTDGSKKNTKKSDSDFMNMALSNARIGFGYTYPNPAVGCVLVRSSTSDETSEDEHVILGSGFHPKAGMPHAEVFALLEAAGAIEDGIAAAKSVMETSKADDGDNVLPQTVEELLVDYSSEGGAKRLFQNCLQSDTQNDDEHETITSTTTAYVTLEPCCHYGKTPPCAMSLVHAGVNRVVIGVRDPNPRVDGGGVKVLQEAGVTVDLVADLDGGRNKRVASDCHKVVDCFIKRITSTSDVDSLEEKMTGAHRSALRSLANKLKSDGTMPELTLYSKKFSINTKAALKDDDDADDAENLIASLFNAIGARFLEEADAKLWSNELLLLRLGGAVKKKKMAKMLGNRIALELNAHVAQTVGHTVLLYRPGAPPVLDLDQLVLGKDSNEEDE